MRIVLEAYLRKLVCKIKVPSSYKEFNNSVLCFVQKSQAYSIHRINGAHSKVNCYMCVFLFLASLPNKLVYKEQHRSWCTLGFIRSIALMPQMCSTLSTSQWITLLMKIVEGHESFTAASLQRQVTCAFPNDFDRP